jgi:uncharacterized protein (DUF2141 family)
MKRSLFSCYFFFAVAVAFVQAQTGAPSVALSGKVIGASGKHAVYVALWDSGGFLTKPTQQVRLQAGSDLAFHFQVPSGTWALSAYEDINENGSLDMGMLGPKEPSGFWHPFHAWRKPRFADVSVTIKTDETHADISLKK